jgi:hypothetical protein
MQFTIGVERLYRRAIIINLQVNQVKGKLPRQESNLRRLDSESSFRTSTEPSAIKIQQKNPAQVLPGRGF